MDQFLVCIEGAGFESGILEVKAESHEAAGEFIKKNLPHVKVTEIYKNTDYYIL